MNPALKNHMTYIWENYSPQNVFSLLKPSDGYSLTEASCQGDKVLVNALPRFAELFSLKNCEPISDNTTVPEYEGEFINCPKNIYDLDDNILNIIFHYLAQLDLLFGHCLAHTCKDLVNEEILKGRYGEELCKDFGELTLQDRDIIVTYLLKYHQSGERTDFFNDVFFDLFGRINNLYNDAFDKNYTRHSAEIYYRHSTKTFYYYCAAEESEYNKKRFRVIKALFADCTTDVHPVWGKYCFGIIDDCQKTYAAAPIIDEIQII